MTTGNFHALFDAQLYKDFVQIVGKGNITKSLTEYMQNVVATQNQDIEGIDIKLVNLEIEKLQKKISKLQSELQKQLQMKDKYEHLQQTAEEKRLLEEKQRIEAATKCINCGSFLEDGKKSHTFPKGNVCNGCFMSATGESIKRWN